MKRKTSVKRMTNEALLKEYAFLESWFGDDFALVSPDDGDYVRSAKLHDEILRRMNGG